MSLLPSRPDASPPDDAGPRVIDVESEDADQVLAALSSETARALLNQLHDEPAPPSELADRLDTSVQNVKYHLDKLEDADAIEVVDTAYSEKGREMDVYAPADQPLVIFAGPEQDRGTLRTALSRLLGGVGILAAASVLVQAMYGQSVIPWAEDDEPDAEPATDDEPAPETGDDTEPTGDEADDDDFGILGDDDEPTENETEATDAADGVNESVNGYAPNGDDASTAAEAAASIPPGVLFFAGGLLVLGLVVGYTYYRHRLPW